MGLAGALGAVARYRVGSAVGVRDFPWATLGINLMGCFLLGALLSGPYPDRWPVSATAAVAVGFLGAFTTFSAFGFDTFTLMRAGRNGAALLYVLTSVIGGVAAVGGGYLVGRALS